MSGRNHTLAKGAGSNIPREFESLSLRHLKSLQSIGSEGFLTFGATNAWPNLHLQIRTGRNSPDQLSCFFGSMRLGAPWGFICGAGFLPGTFCDGALPSGRVWP